MKTLSTMLMTALFATTAIGCATDMTDPGDDGPGTEPVCGDGTCSSNESHATCAQDCPASGPSCGDGVCSGGETTTSCAADCPAGGPVCGDGTCNGSETTASCPSDCPAAACTTQADNCTGENVCVAGSCVAAFGRVYKIVLVDGVMPAKKASGSFWDLDGSLSDPYITLSLNGSTVGSTSSKDNTSAPVWNEFLTTTIAGGSTFVTSVLDDDNLGPGNDAIFACQNAPLTADLLRIHGAPYVTCSGTGSFAADHVRFYFLPQ